MRGCLWAAFLIFGRHMILLIDNYDSFTHTLRDYILQCGFQCRVIRNDEVSTDDIDPDSFSAAVISPGPKTPADSGITNVFIQRFYQSKPILGICLGHQAIGQFFGMRLQKAKYPMHGKTSVIKQASHPLFQGLPEMIEVMRYHSLVVVPDNGSDIEVIASTIDSNEVMAIAHKHLPIAGVQFHPESILTPHGLQIMRNWLVQNVAVQPA